MPNNMSRVEPLIVTSVSPVQIIQSLQIDTVQFQSQLECILDGKTTSFKISFDTTGDCEHTRRKIRFVSGVFLVELEQIRSEAKEIQIGKLCRFLVDEISSGRAVFETKTSDGKVYAIAHHAVASQLNGQYVNKKGKAKEYETIECAGNKFFEQIAESFEKSLQVILAETVNFNREQQKQEKPHQELDKKLQDRQIVAKKESSWSFFRYVYSAIEAVCEIFKSEPAKVQERAIAQERAQVLQAQEKRREIVKRGKEIQTQERRREDRKRDDALFERNREETKLAARRLEA